MPLMYPLKRVMRNWKLFVALLIGIILASTFFAAVDIKANIASKQAFDRQLSSIVCDIEFNGRFNSTNLAYAMGNISEIEGVKDVAVVLRSYRPFKISSDDYNLSWNGPIVSFPNSSRINDEWLNKPVDGIGENETYLIVGQTFKNRVTIGDNISTAMAFIVPKNYSAAIIPVNLTVAGYADFTDKGYTLISGNTFVVLGNTIGFSTSSMERYRYQQDMMIVSWETTVAKLWANVTDGTIDATFLINVDHDALLSPWDIRASSDKVETIVEDIRNNVLANFEFQGWVSNQLGNILVSFENNFASTSLNFLLISFPVFFVAWFLGSTVSDVSYNLRRREIGLLSTKGLSSGQIQRMFLTETLTIGFMGSVIGVVCGLILNQVFLGEFNLDTLFSSNYFNPVTMIFTIIFGMALAFFSAFLSARKASRLPTVEALRDYMDSDVERSYRKRVPWVAFILGAYKIVLFASGANVTMLLAQANASSGNFYVSLLVQVYSIFDSILTYIGPILFFWGLTKILIQNSLKFQQLISGFSRVMGDLGALAVKNVRRNPARLAAIAFLVAFIVGYSVQVSGQLSSEQDYIARQVRSQVGADLTVSVLNATQTPKVLESILGNVSGIKATALECELYQSSSEGITTTMHTIDPDSWGSVAYYEPQWFTGVSMEEAFNGLKKDNMTIILEKRVAEKLNLNIGDQVGINFPSGGRKLTIVGFFGPEPVELPGIRGEKFVDETWSYIPRNLFNMSSEYSDAYKLEKFDEKILIDLEEGINGTAIAEQIRGLDLEILGVESFDEQWAITWEMNNSLTYSSLQNLDVQRMGLVFAVLSASVGTTLVSLVSLKERSREATLMSVRGLSYRQLVWMFLSENIAVITFAVLLGLGVGTIILYGTVSTTGVVIPQLVVRHMAFSSEALFTIATYIALIYASVIVSVLLMSRQYVTKLERMVRLR